MRILVVNYEYPPIGGGGGFVTRDILEHMVKCGHRVSIVTSHFGRLKNHEYVNGVEILRVPVLLRSKLEVASIPSMLSYFPLSTLKAAKKLKDRRYDVINTHFAIPSGPTGYLVSRLFRIPNVLSIHGGDIFDPSKSLSPHRTPFLKQVVKFNLNRADAVVAQSNDTKRNAQKYYNVKRPINVISLGIKKPVYRKKKREDFNLQSDATIFCTIGRLIKRKNLDDSLKILASIKDHIKFSFLVIGEGPERAHLETLVENYNLQNNVRFFGNVSDEVKFQLLDLSDCYLSTALHEGFGLVFLEAMECGLPIICYNRGGQRDFLLDGKTGFLAELGDKETLLQKIHSIIFDHSVRSKIASYNYKLVKNYYIDQCGEKYLNLFDKLISETRSSISITSKKRYEARS